MFPISANSLPDLRNSQARGVATFEFPHVLNLIRELQFDTIYHEHFSYLSLVAVEARSGRKNGLSLSTSRNCRRMAAPAPFREPQGGSRADAAPGGGARRERTARLDAIEGYAGFSGKGRSGESFLLNFRARQGGRQDGRRLCATARQHFPQCLRGERMTLSASTDQRR
jgi:hypothetical protein